MIKLLTTAIATAVAAAAGDWTAPLEVRHEETLCLTYQARLAGGYLLIRATPSEGWKTFVMDNKQRATEKLAGKRSLGQDRATEITAEGGLELSPEWRQSEPLDFSKPELRWFSWGYKSPALFATKVKRTGAAQAALTIRGQACTESTCKNIEVTLAVPVDQSAAAAPAEIETLIAVRP
jgi:hypothetical protein